MDTFLTSSSNQSIFDLKDVDIDPVTQLMRNRSMYQDWSHLIEKGTNGSWKAVLELVLVSLTCGLAETSLKNKVIEELSIDEAEIKVSEFKGEQLKKWKDATRKGVETDDWTDLIQLAKLKNPKVPTVAQGVPIELKDAVIRAWDQTYLGGAHKILLQAVDDLHELRTEHNYAKFLPIIQSSGTGKSRTVDNAGKERILFPMCLREDLGKYLYAYPLPDAKIRQHFELAPFTTEEGSCKVYLKTFLCSLFVSARGLIPELFPDNKTRKYKRIARAFYDHFRQHPNRLEFYDRVVGLAKTRSETEITTRFAEFTNALKEYCSDWPTKSCPVLISLDEVHVLYTRRKGESEAHHSLYSLFRLVLSEVVTCDFGVICMSTGSHIGSLAPSKETAPSLRERDPIVVLPSPFTELPFDVDLIANRLAPGQENLSSVGTLKFTVRFGRPLFNAMYQSRQHEKGDIIKGIMSIIKEKLSGRRWPPELEAPVYLDSSSIGILSVRLNLNLYPATADAREYELELVRNHLRMLFSVPPDRQTIVTGSPPEPLIAEASAEIMHYIHANGKPYMDFWKLLWKYMKHGLASQGATGELIGRGLSICAMDRAINSLRATSTCELKYQTPVTVIDYYKALLTDEAWEKLRRSTPANPAQLSDGSANTTFEDAFKGGYFHFSHYGQANDITPLQSNHAWAYWLRGTAIACELNQELTDRMIPIYFPALGNVSPETISVNLDQDKTSESVSPSSAAIQSAEHLSIFSGARKLPYIAAVHCYALTKDEGIVFSKPSGQIRAKQDNLEAPRYQIDFRGLSAYTAITQAEKSIIRRMINHSKQGVFATHSREYGIAALQRMLPVLATDGASADWYNKPPTAGPSTSDEEQAPSGPGKRLRSESFGTATRHQAATSTVVQHSDGGSSHKKTKKIASVVQPSDASTSRKTKKKKKNR